MSCHAVATDTMPIYFHAYRYNGHFSGHVTSSVSPHVLFCNTCSNGQHASVFSCLNESHNVTWWQTGEGSMHSNAHDTHTRQLL